MAESLTVGLADAPRSIAFEAFGVRIGVTADPGDLLGPVAGLLPPGARRCVPAAVVESFGIIARADGTYRFTRGDSDVVDDADLKLALLMMDNQLSITVGLHAPGRIFVHAGVVACNDRAIVIPGLSMTGKTSLVVALIRAGAVYYSDEFALLDERGYVHPYPKPLSIRDGGEVIQSNRSAESFGAAVGEDPLRVGAVIFTRYRPGADWNPTQLSSGRAALAILQNTVAAKKRSDEALKVIKQALRGAVVLESERGDAAAIAEQVLDRVRAGGESVSA